MEFLGTPNCVGHVTRIRAMDTFSPEKRSEIMKRIKSSNTSIEIKLRKELWRNGVRGWRLQPKDIPGKPDLVFRRKRLAVFIDGCFWHGCPICDRTPKSGDVYWQNKISRNMARDNTNSERLVDLGWTVVRFWEHEVTKDVARCAVRVAEIAKDC